MPVSQRVLSNFCARTKYHQNKHNYKCKTHLKKDKDHATLVDYGGPVQNKILDMIDKLESSRTGDWNSLLKEFQVSKI